MKTILFAAAVSVAVTASGAQAAQWTTSGDIRTVAGTATSYVGPAAQNSILGSVSDGGRDAFDTYGYYINIGSLAYARRSEAFTALNLYRFFDTFTNTSAATVTQTVRFFGNLGSDNNTSIRASGAGYQVTCQFSGTVCGGDPVVAAVYGNNGLGVAGLAADLYHVDYTLTLAPGESASLLNFAFLASSSSTTIASDVDLAISRAQELTANPYLEGLTDQQLVRVANFDLGSSAVPEPSTWAMMIGGFGFTGAAMRRRRGKPALV